MKRIALWGYYGFGNVGDEALLSTVLPYLNDVIFPLARKMGLLGGEHDE